MQAGSSAGSHCRLYSGAQTGPNVRAASVAPLYHGCTGNSRAESTLFTAEQFSARRPLQAPTQGVDHARIDEHGSFQRQAALEGWSHRAVCSWKARQEWLAHRLRWYRHGDSPWVGRETNGRACEDAVPFCTPAQRRHLCLGYRPAGGRPPRMREGPPKRTAPPRLARPTLTPGRVPDSVRSESHVGLRGTPVIKCCGVVVASSFAQHAV